MITNQVQIDLLHAYNNTPNHQNINQLISEYDNKMLYDNCIELQQQGYFTEHIKFHLTMDKKLYSTLIGKNPVLTEKGLEIIQNNN